MFVGDSFEWPIYTVIFLFSSEQAGRLVVDATTLDVSRGLTLASDHPDGRVAWTTYGCVQPASFKTYGRQESRLVRQYILMRCCHLCRFAFHGTDPTLLVFRFAPSAVGG